MSARSRAGADFDCPHIVSDVHSLINKRRAKLGLPEWNFELEPREQWWKRIPEMARQVAEKLLSLGVETRAVRAAFMEISGRAPMGRLQNEEASPFLLMQSLSKEQLLGILAAAKAVRVRDWLMILVAYWHGLRASEVIALTRDNIQDGFLTVQRLKGSNRTTQPLFDHAEPLLNERQALIDYAAEYRGNHRLFAVSRQHLWRLFQKYGKAAGVPQHLCHPHAAKHSVAVHTIDSIGVHRVQAHLGHRSLASTGEYLKVSDADASSAVARALKG